MKNFKIFGEDNWINSSENVFSVLRVQFTKGTVKQNGSRSVLIPVPDAKSWYEISLNMMRKGYNASLKDFARYWIFHHDELDSLEPEVTEVLMDDADEFDQALEQNSRDEEYFITDEYMNVMDQMDGAYSETHALNVTVPEMWYAFSAIDIHSKCFRHLDRDSAYKGMLELMAWDYLQHTLPIGVELVEVGKEVHRA